MLRIATEEDEMRHGDRNGGSTGGTGSGNVSESDGINFFLPVELQLGYTGEPQRFYSVRESPEPDWGSDADRVSDLDNDFNDGHSEMFVIWSARPRVRS